MRLLFLTALTMMAFAANSILNRLSLAEGEIGPASFALIRVGTGAVVLILLARATARPGADRARPNIASVLSLAVYLVGFSFAYISLDTGVGALILFGGVQMTMFAGALMAREPISVQRWMGSVAALGGLVWLLAPGEFSPAPGGAVLMGFAALGWGVFSLMGRKTTNPLAATQTSFLWALPLVFVVWALFPDTKPMTPTGIFYATLSGTLTSALGYYLWYSILPRLDTIVASTAQLTVPAIAMLGGALLLNEPITTQAMIAAALIMSGVFIAARK